ncbi:hypothetical protein WDL1P1_00822 (plasmid) [Variovorax sp. WDL1]|nr:hypothetical protein CHC06_05479 [Variovorax sp. B2]PNG50770.1 hypothetical protein CHC07_05384 [Variovorax sp. B4]VTV17984.1 hypothetical protein WDL1P1_00822 [Variovorax sp. WDL1]
MPPSDTDLQAPSSAPALREPGPEGTLLPAHVASAAVGPSLARLVRNAAPSLWAKARADRRLAREQTERMLDLLVWVLEKNGARVTRTAKQEYFHEGRVIEGRLDLFAERGVERLALELAFRPGRTTCLKLLAARRAGAVSLLLAGFARTPEEARQAVDRLLGRPTDGWFALACL